MLLLSKNFSLIKQGLKNPASVYVLSRYLTYAIQLINSLLIAEYLGPYYLGVWSFCLLVFQYTQQVSLGIPHSMNVIVSVNKKNESLVKKIIGNSTIMILLLGIIFVLFFLIIHYFDIEIGKKYIFSRYYWHILIIAILWQINNLFISFNRIYGRVLEVAFSQSIFPFLVLFFLLFKNYFSPDSFIYALLYINLFSILISLILSLFRLPLKFSLNFDSEIIKQIQKKGWYLFLYNSGFYVIFISSRSFISTYFSVDEFGYFSFAFTMANAVFMLLDSFSYVVFPKIINKLGNSAPKSVIALVSKIRIIDITLSSLLVYIFIALSPFLLLFFPKYQNSLNSLIAIFLTLLLIKNSTGFLHLLISNNKEKILALVSSLTLVLNVISIWCLIKFLNVAFSDAILGTALSYLFFNICISYFYHKKLGINRNLKEIFFLTYSLGFIIPYSLLISFYLLRLNIYVYPLIILIIFILLNFKKLIKIKSYTMKVIKGDINLINF